jgi:hypothetical protein
MYLTHKQIKKRLTKKQTKVDKCFSSWLNCLDDVLKCIDESDELNAYNDELDEFSDDDSDDNPLVKIENMKFLVKDIIKTIQFFGEDTINNHVEHKRFMSAMAKLITRKLFVKRIDIKIKENDLVVLLDLIDWDCELLFSYAKDWTISKEDTGYDIIKILQLARKYKRDISGITSVSVIYSLLMAVYYEDKYAEQFIIYNKIKLPKELIDSNDALISDMIEYFSKYRNYNLLPDK